jgi:hypothetical protein
MQRLAMIFAAAMILVPPAAHSTEGGYWTTKVVGYARDGTARYARVYCRNDGRCYRPGRHRVSSRETSRESSATRVYGYMKRESVEELGLCREVRRAVGDQHLTQDGAKKAANDAWAGTVRFHLGEKFMDLGNARNVVYTCSRSSIKEGGVTTLGQSLTRCEIEAVPCHPPRQMESAEK